MLVLYSKSVPNTDRETTQGYPGTFSITEVGPESSTVVKCDGFREMYSCKAKREIHILKIPFIFFSLILFHLFHRIMSVFVVSDGDTILVQG